MNAIRNGIADGALPVTSGTIHQEIAKVPLLQKVIQYLRQGGPKLKTLQPEQSLNRHDSLTIIDGCPFSADDALAPDTRQRHVLRGLHSGHPGISRTKMLPRSIVHWPGLDHQIADIVRQCTSRLRQQKDQLELSMATYKEMPILSPPS
ncbi:hypothetical protein M513_10195 [Trichuris suis]|uniref:RNA-directed DNA polymerase n=1 Tax=Trichuris suis TaxID=68888 RepID=A0A085LVF8_9BILA|nr:hypothetical protein M513_10195 [Trichuris suis]